MYDNLDYTILDRCFVSCDFKNQTCLNRVTYEGDNLSDHLVFSLKPDSNIIVHSVSSLDNESSI